MKRLNHRFTCLILFIVFLFTQSAISQTNSQYSEKLKAFEQFVEAQMALDKTPGVSVGFMKGDFVWTKGFGYADVENKTPAKAESAYRLASVTKPMTAVAVMQLVEKGKIDLDAEVQTYVPYFPKKQWPVTVRQLLGHLGGISHYRNYDLEGHFKEHKNTREAIAVFENFDLVAEPGTKYSYSSYGYNLLGAVIEGASGKSYGDYMRENVWDPLGMNDTRMDDPLDLIPHRVRGYQIINGQIKNSEFVDISSRFAAGGTRSTVIDLLKFAKGMNEEKFLSRQSLDIMFTSMSLSNGFYTGYGMGWGIAPINGRFSVSHGGGQAETRTRLVNFPSENAAIAIGCNFEGANPTVYAQRLFELIFDSPWESKVYLGNQIDEAIFSGMQSVFNYGLAYFDRYRESLSKNQEELSRAFAYFNENVDRNVLKTDQKGAMQKVNAGVHPVADQAFIKLGSFMAAKLAEKFGAARLATYHQTGAITFFHDYIELYGQQSDYPKFKPEFAKLVREWQKDWNKTWNDYTRQLAITSASDFEALTTKLKQNFAGAKVYPDFNERFIDVVIQFYTTGQWQKALKVGELAVALYPASDGANALFGVTQISSGNADKALASIQKAVNINPNGMASAGTLNQIAYQLAGAGRAEDGIELLKIAVKLHPKEANLYDSIGEFYLNKGDKPNAIEYYNKALEVDPNFENAKRMLKKIMDEKSD